MLSSWMDCPEHSQGISNYSALDSTVKSIDMYIELSGTHAYNMSLSVKLPIDDSKYKKIGEDVLDAEDVNDSVSKWFEPYLSDASHHSDDFAAWYKGNEENAWFDLREDDEGVFYAAAGDNGGIKFLDRIDFFTIDYNGFEINIEGLSKDYYAFGFWIGPDGGILRASDEERGFGFYDDLDNSQKNYSKQEYTLKSALDDLIAHSDDYQNPDNEEKNEEEA